MVSTRGQSVTTNRRSAVQFITNAQAAGVTPLERNITIGGESAAGTERTATHAYGEAREDVRLPFTRN